MTDTTIILTTHNRPVMFETALSSAIATGARVLVVDDGSDPVYAKADIRFPKAIGYAHARLAALEEVDTPFVAFLDDDDILMADWLELSLDAMATGFGVVAASYIETDAQLGRLRTHVLTPATLAGLLEGHCPVNDGALIRRSVLDGTTWHPERDTVMMFSLWLALAAKGVRFGVVDKPCWYHRLHGANMSGNLDERDERWRAEAIAEYGP